MNYDLPSDEAFTYFLNTTDLDTVRLEQATHMSPAEWHALARDRRTR